MTDGIIILLLALVLLFVLGLHGKFAQGPESVRKLAQEEIEKAEAQGEIARRALREEIAGEASTILDGIKLLHEQTGEQLRSEIRASEARARAAEKATADVTTALDAATRLVRELRDVLDERRAGEPLKVPPPEPAPPESDARATVEMANPKAPPEAMDDEPEEELTQVAKRPLAGTRAAANGLRIAAARAAIPPPAGAAPASDGGPRR